MKGVFIHSAEQAVSTPEANLDCVWVIFMSSNASMKASIHCNISVFHQNEIVSHIWER